MFIFSKFHDLLSPVLSDRTIKKYNKQKLLIEEPLTDFQLQPNSVDLTLDKTWLKPVPNNHVDGKGDCIDVLHRIHYDAGIFDFNVDNKSKYGFPVLHKYFLKPGEFVLFSSKETLNIPNGIIAFVQGRSSIARLGVQTEQAGLIDSGFRGQVTFEFKNETDYPILLHEGLRVAQVYFIKAQYANILYGSNQFKSKYQEQHGATGSRIDEDWENQRFRNR